MNKLSQPLLIKFNQAAMCIAESTQYQSKTKHIDIKYHYIRKKVLDNTVLLTYCPTYEILADVLTKALSTDKFTGLRKITGITEISACE